MDIYLKFFNNDCWNCYFGYYQLKKIYPGARYCMIFESDLRTDSTILKEKFSIPPGLNYTFIFSDSLYHALEKSTGSEILLLNNHGQVVFRELMKNFDVSLFSKVYDLEETESGILQRLVRDLEQQRFIEFEFAGQFLVLTDIFQKKSLIDLHTGRRKKIEVSDELVSKAYAVGYGTEGHRMKSIIDEKLSEGFDNFKPRLNSIGVGNDSMLLVNFMIYHVKSDGRDTVYTPVNFIGEYNVNEGRSGRVFNLKLPEGYFLGHDFFVDRNRLLVGLYSEAEQPTPETRLFASFQQKGNSFSFERILNFVLPANYFRYKLLGNFNQFVYRNGVFGMIYGESLFDNVESKLVPIPVDSGAYSGLAQIYSQFSNRGKADYVAPSYISLTDVFRHTDSSYSILYLYGQQVHFLHFDARRIRRKTIIRNLDDKDEYLYPRFYYDSRYVAFKKSRSDVFEIVYTGD